MRTIVFDLDGTLVDSAPDLISTLNLVLAAEGLPSVGYDAARRMIGGGSRRMIERALIAQGRNVPAAELDRMFRIFIDHYSAHIAERSRPFPHLEACSSGSSAKDSGSPFAPTNWNGFRGACSVL
jgi:phosphoglycolate phosphatase